MRGTDYKRVRPDHAHNYSPHDVLEGLLSLKRDVDNFELTSWTYDVGMQRVRLEIFSYLDSKCLYEGNGWLSKERTEVFYNQPTHSN